MSEGPETLPATPGERPNDTVRTPAGPVTRDLKHRHRPSSLLGTHFGPRLPRPSRVPFPLFQPAYCSCYDYSNTKKSTSPWLRELPGLPCCVELSPHHILFCHGLCIPFAAVPSKQGPGPAQKHSKALQASHTCHLPKQGLSLGSLKDVADLNLVLGHTPNRTRTESPPTPFSPASSCACWPLLLGRSAHQAIGPSLRCPLLTTPLPFVNLFPNPPKKPKPVMATSL